MVEVEWEPEKAERNLQRHAVAFTEALTIFGDPLEVTIADVIYSDSEFRFLSLGRSGRLLVVAYTERQARIRIISAREATRKERRDYESEPR